MAKSHAILGTVFVLFAFFAGCCGPSSPSSSSHCTTYGDACTEFCGKGGGQFFSAGTDCFSGCMSDVKAQNLGDSTTCCRETLRTNCQNTCNSKWQQMVAKYGDSGGMDQGEESDFLEGCMAECTGIYDNLGMSPDYCSLVDAGQLI
jgi:hypothetical protein